jgi:hypothetical protein
MKKLSKKITVLLAALSLSGGLAIPANASISASADKNISTKGYIGTVYTYRERYVENGVVKYDLWGGKKEINVPHDFVLYEINHTVTDYGNGKYLEQWLYGVRVW